MSRILVIRGGAIGDFILTLPAIGLLREAFPEASIDILGYQHIVELARHRYYAQGTRSIEYAGLASFFVPNGRLSKELSDYFAGFSQVISYLYDPDLFFETNLRKAGVKHLITGDPRLHGTDHATRQLARPLERLALYLEPEHQGARLHPTQEDRNQAAAFLANLPQDRPLLAIHPGSGGRHKLWPQEHWQALLDTVADWPLPPALLIIGGEADEAVLNTLSLPPLPCIIARHLPLPLLAAVIEQATLFVGHDSGISHLAAGVGTPSILLFGPTDPAVWAPVGNHVEVLLAPENHLADLSPATLVSRIKERIGHPGTRL